MQLPADLRGAIDRELELFAARDLAQAVAELTRSYKAGQFERPVMTSTLHRAAYLAVRLPATYAAVARVFADAAEAMPGCAPESLLDLGAGPGTAAWAAAAAFPSLQCVTLVEADAQLIALGRRLAASSDCAALRGADWLCADLRRAASLPAAELVVVSYALGELPAEAAAKLVAAAWQSATSALVIVEPGTRAGFAGVLAARQALLEMGATLAAPCPHGLACPLAAAGDWCHFAQRVERTAAHRRLKQAALGHEDEKFSYLVAARQAAPAAARVVRHPLIRPGHIQLALCTAEGLQQQTVTRSRKERFRAARRAEWGSAWRMDDAE